MKKLIISFICLTSITFSQVKWEILSPYPTCADIYDSWVFNDSTVIIVGKSGLCLRTTDAGETWNKCSINSISNFRDIHFVNSNIGYLLNDHDKLFKTVDGGITWSEHANLWDFSGAIYFRDENNGYVSTQDYLFATSNGGNTWQGLLNSTVYKVKFKGNTGYFSTELDVVRPGGKLLKTTNFGNTWETIYSVLGKPLHDFDVNSQGVIVGVSGSYIARTSNNGVYWSFYQYPGKSFNDVHFLNDTTLIIAGSISIISTNTGEDWTTISDNRYMRSTGSGVNNSYIFGSEGLMMKSTDNGNSWTDLSKRNNYQPNSVFFLSPETAFFTGYEATDAMRPFLKKTTDGCSTWEDIPWPHSSVAAVDITFIDGGNTGVAIAPKGIFRSTDGGMNWSEVPAGLNSTSNLKKIVFVDDLYGFILDRNINLYKTSDGGASWSKIYINLNENPNGIKFLDRLTGFLAGNNMAIFKTTDGGLTWNRKTQGGGYPIVGLHFFNDMEGYAFTSGSLTYPVRNVYYTSDRGETWSEKDSMPAFSFVDFFNRQNGMALISGGYNDPSITIGVSRDGGEWYKEDLPIPLTGTFMKMADPSTAYIFGQNGTIIRFKDMSYTSIEDEETAGIINTFSLSQNYPNPFNPETVIRFALPEAGFVKGVVYDILGREVTTLLNGEMNPGNHEVKFDAMGFASGVYFFRLEAGKYSSAIKMVVNK